MSELKFLPEDLYNAFDDHGFDENSCFLCGTHLDGSNRSDEHVFPKWLQRRFGLWTQTITLLNGTTIPYRSLKVPCCIECNNEHLSVLENSIKTKLFADNEKKDTPGSLELFQWVAKIFFGIIFREVLLPSNRADENSESILDRRNLKNFKALHLFLQSIRVPMHFGSTYADFPASIFLFDLQSPKTQFAQFDFQDDIIYQTIFLRLGTVGILAAFDGGAVDFEIGERVFRKYTHQKLHPNQFEELGATLFYKAYLFQKNPLYYTVEAKGKYFVSLISMDNPNTNTWVDERVLDDGRIVVKATMPEGAEDKPTFGKWDMEEYRIFLARFLHWPIAQIEADSEKIMSLLVDEKGDFLRVDIEQLPWRGVP